MLPHNIPYITRANFKMCPQAKAEDGIKQVIEREQLVQRQIFHCFACLLFFLLFPWPEGTSLYGSKSLLPLGSMEVLLSQVLIHSLVQILNNSE